MTHPTCAGGSPKPTYRERHRARRHQEFLDTALDIVASGGLGSLTMKAVTDVLECSEGSIYQYFPSKGALVAAVQNEAIVVLGGSLTTSQAGLTAALDVAGAEERVAALARVLGAARFWVAADAVFPREVELTRMLFTSPVDVLSPQEAETVVPAGKAMIDLGTDLFDAAAAVGALDPGDGFERTVVVLTATTGVLMASGLKRWEGRVADTRPFADRMVTAQFLAWGADPDDLAQADEVIGALAATGTLVPATGG